MGKTLADSFPEAARVFQEADEALGFPLSRLCFEGPDDQLKLTENTQPALLTVSIAAHAVLAAKGIAPAYVAGHSLGEYSALVAAGSLRFADAVRLVRKRGQYMQQAVPAGVGAMAALLKLPAGKLEAFWPKPRKAKSSPPRISIRRIRSSSPAMPPPSTARSSSPRPPAPAEPCCCR